MMKKILSVFVLLVLGVSVFGQAVSVSRRDAVDNDCLWNREFAVNIERQFCPETPTVTDIDDNTYTTVQIGHQCWMRENLRTTRYADGTPISQGGVITSLTIAYWQYPCDSASYKHKYGLLYNWQAVMHGLSSFTAAPSGVKGICPDGWHVPTDAEWTELEDYVGSQSRYVCGNSNRNIAKALASTTDWQGSTNPCDLGNSLNSNNATGFSALPAGTFFQDAVHDFGLCAYFWTATSDDAYNAFYRYLNSGLSCLRRNYESKVVYFSVRCVKN